MTDLNSILIAGLAGQYERLGARVQELAAPLNDVQFWQRPFPYGNSFGHLVLHLTGNLKYYIGAEIAGTGYVRDREREFTENERPTKAEALQRFDEAIAIVVKTVRAQREEDWGRAYTALREADAQNRLGILLRCASHLHHHIGQMTYLCHEVARAG
jgi:hypothetical protein